MKITSPEIFLKYALPCGQVHVKRGNMEQKLLDNSIEYVSSGREIPKKMEENLEKIFFTAKERCTAVAKKSNMHEIDGMVIRDYFLRVHNKFVDIKCKNKSYENDFDPEICKVKCGKVIDIYEQASSGKIAVVRTNGDIKNYRTDFVPGLKIEDDVSVHYDFVVEVLGKELMDRYFK